MDQNYTPLDLDKFQDNKTTTFLLVLAIITLTILAVVLFLFIQKKLQENSQVGNQLPQNEEKIISPSPTVVNKEASPFPTKEATDESNLSPAPISPTIIEEETPPASLSPTEVVSPTIIENNESH